MSGARRPGRDVAQPEHDEVAERNGIRGCSSGCSNFDEGQCRTRSIDAMKKLRTIHR
jgi:hypothetical protein